MAEATAFKLDPIRDIPRLLAVQAYIREAWKLALAKKIPSVSIKTSRFSSLSPKTKLGIEKLSKELWLGSTIALNANPEAFTESWTEKEFSAFFKQNPSVEQIISNSSAIVDFENNKKAADRWNKWAAKPLSLVSGLCDAAAFKYPLPPVDWILSTVSSTALFLKNVSHHQAMKFDPKLQGKKQSKLYSAYSSIAGSIALMGLSVSAFATGPVAVVAAPILLAIGALSISLSHLIAAASTILELKKEITQKKDPKDTYKLRVFQKGLKLIKQGMSSIFYLAMSTLAVAAVVALVANPIGLSVLGGSMLMLAAVTAGISLVTTIAAKMTGQRIKTIDKKHAVEENLNNSLAAKDSLELQHRSKQIIEEINHISFVHNSNQNAQVSTKKVESHFTLMADAAIHKHSNLMHMDISKTPVKQNNPEKKSVSIGPMSDITQHDKHPPKH